MPTLDRRTTKTAGTGKRKAATGGKARPQGRSATAAASAADAPVRKRKPVTGVRRGLARAARALGHAAMRRLDVDALRVERADARSIRVGRVTLGEASAGRVTLSGIRSTVNTGQAIIDGLDVMFSLRTSVEWRVRVLFFRRSGSFSLGETPSFPFPLDGLAIPALDPIALAVDDATLDGASVEVQPIADLVFNGARVDDIGVETLRLPSNGFALAGLGYESLEIGHLGVPDATIGRVRIGRVRPDEPLTLPRTEIRNVSIPDARAPEARNTAPVAIDSVTGSVRPITLLNLGFVRVRIRVTPVLDMRLRGFSLNDIRAETTIGSVRVDDIRSPLEIRDVALEDVDAADLRLERISA